VNPRPASDDPSRDPFRERRRAGLRWSARVLGARVEFTSNSRELIALARQAFAGVPAHRWPKGRECRLRVRLQLNASGRPAWKAPPPPALASGEGMLFAHVDAGNFAVVAPELARAVVEVGRAFLRHPHLLRRELLEFAVITLATRAQGLVPLHAGCVGLDGEGLLLLGDSGAGKSTLTFHAALSGLEFLAEDSVFVHPVTLQATGLSAFVHARSDSLTLIGDAAVRRAVRRSPEIRRRSGVRKREFDLRRHRAKFARHPLRIVAAAEVSARRSGKPLAALGRDALRRALRTSQAYARAQPGWREFERRMLRAGGFRLRRQSPDKNVAALLRILSGRRR
jgi:hypothetical protein